MGVERETSARERGLFEFLAASRPQRGWREGIAATAASIAGHGAIIGVVVLATVLTTRIASTDPPAMVEKVDVVELTTPLLSLNGRLGPATAPQPEPAKSSTARPDAHTHTPAPARHEHEGKLADLIPPRVVPEDIPMPKEDAGIPSLQVSEYDGIGQDTTLTAAAIFADHHERTADQLADGPPAPEETPYTQAPQLINGDEMQKLLSRKYPPLLKDQGIGGRVLLWFLVDEFGHARRWLLKQSSGEKALDKAAMNVASLMRFSPALNYDRRVSVWVVLPVTFQVVDAS